MKLTLSDSYWVNNGDSESFLDSISEGSKYIDRFLNKYVGRLTDDVQHFTNQNTSGRKYDMSVLVDLFEDQMSSIEQNSNLISEKLGLIFAKKSNGEEVPSICKNEINDRISLNDFDLFEVCSKL
jgi:hypothetical protein